MVVAELKTQLLQGRRRIDGAEFEWLEGLAEFDVMAGYLVDGQLNCVSWLVAHCGMSRATAHDKLRVAHELRRRRVIAEAVAAGTLSYCKVRAITRIIDVDDDTDAALVEAAASLGVADLEGLVRDWKKLRDQDNPDHSLERWAKRGVHRQHSGVDGMLGVQIVGTADDVERLLRILDTQARSTAEDIPVLPAGPADDPNRTATLTQRRYDALMDLIDAGVAHLAAGDGIDVEKTLVEVVVGYETLVERAPGVATLPGGAALTGDEARRLACDAGIVRLIVKGASEVLDVGRKTSQWTVAQRRAISARHHGRCFWTGCGRPPIDIHHTDPFGDGGETNLDLGVPVCKGHHRLVHAGGWTVSYDPITGITTTRPPGPQGEAIHHRSHVRTLLTV